MRKMLTPGRRSPTRYMRVPQSPQKWLVGHGLARAYPLRLAERLEAVLPARVLKVRVLDGEVAGEHGRRDLAAVDAVADEGVDDALERLCTGSHSSAQSDTLDRARACDLQ